MIQKRPTFLMQESAAEAFLGMLDDKNFGKLLVPVS
jgi:hypothetical protein